MAATEAAERERQEALARFTKPPERIIPETPEEAERMRREQDPREGRIEVQTCIAFHLDRLWVSIDRTLWFSEPIKQGDQIVPAFRRDSWMTLPEVPRQLVSQSFGLWMRGRSMLSGQKDDGKRHMLLTGQSPATWALWITTPGLEDPEWLKVAT